MRKFAIIAGVSVAAVLALTVAGYFYAVSQAREKARTTLEISGYTDIEITGMSWWGCSSDDRFCSAFRAVAPNGAPVTGAVGSSWFKGATIRVF